MAKRVEFAVECVSVDIISLKCLLHLNGEVFLEKLEIMMERVLWKNRFHPFEKHLYQNGKAENMQVVAGSLVH